MISRMGKALCAAFGGLVLSASWLPVLCPPAGAQSLRETVSQQVASDHIGDAFKALSIFSGTPGISAANYYTDDLTLDTYKLPLSYTFEAFDGGALDGISPYIEMTLGFLYGKQDFDLFIDSATPTRIDSTYRTYTGLGGVGLEIPLGDSVVVRPIFMAGYSRVESDSSFSGPYADTIKEDTKGVLFDVSINSILLGGALEAAYKHTFADDLRFDATLRYDHFADKAYNASDPSLETTGNFGVATGGAEINGPTDLRLLGRDLRWIGLTSATVFTGPQRDDLGFQYFFELGGGVEFVDPEVVRGLQGFSIRTSALMGADVIGWTVGLSLEF